MLCTWKCVPRVFSKGIWIFLISIGLKIVSLWKMTSQTEGYVFFTFAGYKSFLETNSLVTLALYKTNLEDSINSNNFFVNVNLAIIQWGSVPHMSSSSWERGAGFWKLLFKKHYFWVIHHFRLTPYFVLLD